MLREVAGIEKATCEGNRHDSRGGIRLLQHAARMCEPDASHEHHWRTVPRVSERLEQATGTGPRCRRQGLHGDWMSSIGLEVLLSQLDLPFRRRRMFTRHKVAEIVQISRQERNDQKLLELCKRSRRDRGGIEFRDDELEKALQPSQGRIGEARRRRELETAGNRHADDSAELGLQGRRADAIRQLLKFSIVLVDRLHPRGYHHRFRGRNLELLSAEAGVPVPLLDEMLLEKGDSRELHLDTCSRGAEGDIAARKYEVVGGSAKRSGAHTN